MIRAQMKAPHARPQGVPFLATLEGGFPGDRTVQLGRGDLFGEIGALNGWPQSVTARTRTACQLVQIRVPALQRLREESTAFKERVDRVYRERALLFHLRSLPLLAGCDDATIQSLANEVELVSLRPGATLVQEGKPVDAMFLVRSGCLKLAQRMGDGEIAVSYLSKGMVLGDVEFVLRDQREWFSTASSVGYSELVKMGPAVVARLRERPEIEKQMWDSAVTRVKETGYARQHVDYGELLDFSLQRGLVQGSSVLVIDLERCTRCDDCVRACAETHGGQPRFVRDGPRYQHHLIARACYHCRDPVCLVGCPTGAIHRAQVGDVVEIQEAICIGCKSCATKCPYDAIIMQPTGESWADDAIPEQNRGKPRLVASKCDLCHTSPNGPACVNNCPQGCAIRVGTMEEFKGLLWPTKRGSS
jgi:Fe-S-cluster-containing dehydrogenase component/CRP-like cAMP-binding protein